MRVKKLSENRIMVQPYDTEYVLSEREARLLYELLGSMLPELKRDKIQPPNTQLKIDGLDAKCAECGKYITDPLYCSGCMYNQPTT